MELQGGGDNPVPIVPGVRRRGREHPAPSAVRVREQCRGALRDANEVALGGRDFSARLLPNT